MLSVGSHISVILGEELSNVPYQQGAPLLMHIWSISCPSCKTNMPTLQGLRDDYSGRGLQTIAVHMPRGDHDLNESEVRLIANEIGVSEVLILDNDHKVVNMLGVNAVPAYFLFDAEGKLRRQSVGNFGVRFVGEALKRLLGEVHS